MLLPTESVVTIPASIAGSDFVVVLINKSRWKAIAPADDKEHAKKIAIRFRNRCFKDAIRMN